MQKAQTNKLVSLGFFLFNLDSGEYKVLIVFIINLRSWVRHWSRRLFIFIFLLFVIIVVVSISILLRIIIELRPLVWSRQVSYSTANSSWNNNRNKPEYCGGYKHCYQCGHRSAKHRSVSSFHYEDSATIAALWDAAGLVSRPLCLGNFSLWWVGEENSGFAYANGPPSFFLLFFLKSLFKQTDKLHKQFSFFYQSLC